MGLALFAIDPDGGEARARSGQADRSAPALRQCGIFGMVWAESIASILYALPVLEKVNINLNYALRTRARNRSDIYCPD